MMLYNGINIHSYHFMIPTILIYAALIYMLIVLCSNSKSSVAYNREKNQKSIMYSQVLKT